MDVARKLIPQPDERFYTARNEKFDRLACAELERELPKRNTCEPWIVFSYAHSCRKLFHLAKEAGIRTVLGQFDPGPLQADIADREHAAHPQFRTSWKRYSDSYVQAWWDEVRLADNVLVNSTHSKDCLVRVGVPVEKIATIPLVYLPPATHNPERNYPRTFNRDRPLRVLFLGQVILLKGIARLIDAAKLLKDEAIDVRIVGPTNIDNLGDLCRGLPVNYVGSVPRDEVSREYQNADVFILPTLSDGFAITQLEALAWRLPVVTTTYCGEVVKNQVNGIALSEPTAENIANTLRQFLETPQRLAEMSRQARPEDFGIDRLAAQLETLANRWTK
ncbi:MAG: glycosyltransferase family 4 protein [Pirellulales bacterium]